MAQRKETPTPPPEPPPSAWSLLASRGSSRIVLRAPFETRRPRRSIGATGLKVASAPLQFLPDHAEKRDIRQRRQWQRLLCFADGDYRSALNMYRLAAIQRQEHRIVRIARFDLNCRSLGDNDRSIREDVWANRCDHENSRLRIEDRAAGRQRVSGRTCRRCNDQAVGIELSEWFAIDPRAQHHQARKFAAA